MMKLVVSSIAGTEHVNNWSITHLFLLWLFFLFCLSSITSSSSAFATSSATTTRRRN